jgi:hypothetical protein
MDGENDGMYAFTLTYYCCILLRPHLAFEIYPRILLLVYIIVVIKLHDTFWHEGEEAHTNPANRVNVSERVVRLIGCF